MIRGRRECEEERGGLERGKDLRKERGGLGRRDKIRGRRKREGREEDYMEARWDDLRERICGRKIQGKREERRDRGGFEGGERGE